VQLIAGHLHRRRDDIDATVLAGTSPHRQIPYPQAYLSVASAVLLGPTRKKPFLIARRKQVRASGASKSSKRGAFPSVRAEANHR